jgi:hypothetical protein
MTPEDDQMIPEDDQMIPEDDHYRRISCHMLISLSPARYTEYNIHIG